MTQAKAKTKAVLAARVARDTMIDHGIAGPVIWGNVLAHVPSSRKLKDAVANAFA
jgi:hypothetical protein